MISNKTFIRCIVLLSIITLGSSLSSSLRGSINNKDIAQSSDSSSSAHQYSARLLQNNVQQQQQPTNSSGGDSGSTLVIVGAVGAVLSIFVLIGGVCYAKRQYSDNAPGGGRQYLNEEKDISNIISNMEKNAAKKEKGGGGGGGYFKRGNNKEASDINNNERATAADDEVGYESDIPPPPPENLMNDDEQTSDDESDMHFMSSNNNGRIGAGNKSVADHTTADDDMSFAFSVDQSSIAPYNKQQRHNQAIDPFIGGAAMQSFKNEKGGVFEWNEDGTKMVYTPAMADVEKQAQNGFVWDERKKKWVVTKQVVGAKGVSFKPTTSANDGKSSAMMMTESPNEMRRSHSDASTRSAGSGATGFSGLTGMGSEFTFNAVGSDYSTVRTRSGTTFVSTGIAIPSPSGALRAEGVEVEGVSDFDRLMLTDDEDLSDGSTHGHVADELLGDEEPGMIVPKKTVGRLNSNTIKEDTPFDEWKRPSPKPVPKFDNTSRQFVRKNRKPSFGRRV